MRESPLTFELLVAFLVRTIFGGYMQTGSEVILRPIVKLIKLFFAEIVRVSRLCRERS